MKIIFLDIDGVLNCKAAPNPRNFPYIVDKKLLLRLNGFWTKAKLRWSFHQHGATIRSGILAAKHWGIPFIDVTPDMPRRPRRDEIVAWLKKHPDVKRFAVIDDDDDELDEMPLFQPSADIGLTSKITEGVYRYLAGKTDEDMRSSAVKRLIQNVRTALQGHKG